MSQSVVKKALQLMQEEMNPTDHAAQGKKRKTKNAMKVIGTKRKGVWKELRRLHKQEQEQMKIRREQKPDFKSTIEKYQEEQLVSKMNDKTASHPVATNANHIKNAKKVLEFHLQSINRRNQKMEIEKKEEGTVFTDRDFDKFEEEYDFF